MKDESGGPVQPDESADRDRSGDWHPISDRVLAVIVVFLATALVLGYLFLNKLADISSEEDCALAHRANCAPVELQR